MPNSLRCKRFQSSYCANVRVGVIHFFFWLLSQLSRRTRAETGLYVQKRDKSTNSDVEPESNSISVKVVSSQWYLKQNHDHKSRENTVSKIYEFSSTQLTSTAVPESCSISRAAELVRELCSAKPKSKLFFRHRASAVLLSNLIQQLSSDDRSAIYKLGLKMNTAH